MIKRIFEIKDVNNHSFFVYSGVLGKKGVFAMNNKRYFMAYGKNNNLFLNNYDWRRKFFKISHKIVF